MHTHVSFYCKRSTYIWPLLALILAAAFVLLVSGRAQAAAEPDTAPPDNGCGCHSAETATWQSSPHAQLVDGKPVATCQTCHGEYKRGHPDTDSMRLPADSKVCSTCHAGTFDQFSDTMHAKAGVQCIGCHVAHSQNLRLSTQELCRSCHRDTLQDAFHVAHWLGDAPCTSCHMATAPRTVAGAIASTDPAVILAATPRHDFVTVSAQKCVDCHKNDVKTAPASPVSAENPTLTRVLAAANEAPQLRSELAAAEQTNRTLAIFNPISLGLGLGFGSIVGIVGMLVLVRINRSKEDL